MINSISNKFNHIIRLGKDKHYINEKCHVVYKINCCDCDASYVSQTFGKLIVRSKEHASDCKLRLLFGKICKIRTNLFKCCLFLNKLVFHLYIFRP